MEDVKSSNHRMWSYVLVNYTSFLKPLIAHMNDNPTQIIIFFLKHNSDYQSNVFTYKINIILIFIFVWLHQLSN